MIQWLLNSSVLGLRVIPGRTRVVLSVNSSKGIEPIEYKRKYRFWITGPERSPFPLLLPMGAVCLSQLLRLEEAFPYKVFLSSIMLLIFINLLLLISHWCFVWVFNWKALKSLQIQGDRFCVTATVSIWQDVYAANLIWDMAYHKFGVGVFFGGKCQLKCCCLFPQMHCSSCPRLFSACFLRLPCKPN